MKINYYSRMLPILLFLLSGCASLVPKDKKPGINVPTRWSLHDKKTVVSPVKINSLAWWQKFHDPQLDQLISEALVRNNDLGIATGNLLQARAYVQKIQLSWLPTVGLGGVGFTSQISNFNFQAPGPIFPGIKPNDSVLFDGYMAGFVPNYTLNVMQQLKLGEVAHLSLALQEAAKNAVRLGVISQVAGSYFSLLGLKKQLTLQKQLVSDAKALRKYTNIQYQSGAISEENLDVSDQLIATLQKKIPTLQHNITLVENALNVLIDKNPAPMITHNNFSHINTEGIIPINLPSETLKARPDVVIADYQLHIQQAMIGVAASQLFPSINLTGLLGTASLELGSLLRFNNKFGIGELIAGVPIINLGIYADISKAKGAQYTAYYNYVKTVRNAFSDVENALSQHSTINQSCEQQYLALKKAIQQSQIGLQQYKQGMIGYSETIMYKTNVDYMKIMENDCKMQQMGSIVNLYQVLGGGYLAKVG